MSNILDPKWLILGIIIIIIIVILITITELMNPILFITGVLSAIVMLIFVDKVYIPYFLPGLNELQDNKKGSILSGREHKADKYMIKGILPLSTSEIMYNTNNKMSNQYVKMDKSVNASNGTELSYSFWLNKRPSPNYADRTILLKGTKNRSKNDPVEIKAPLIKFGNNSEELIIEFNTIKKKHNKVLINSDVFKVTAGDTWYLVTVIFQDYKDPANGNKSTGVQVLVYLNDHLIESGKVFRDDALQLNNSPIYILPDINEKEYHNLSGRIADLRYHNYALSQSQIMDLHNQGHNKESYKTALQLNDSQFGDTTYYKLGLRNNTDGI
jgi:hypothetical protein